MSEGQREGGESGKKESVTVWGIRRKSTWGRFVYMAFLFGTLPSLQRIPTVSALRTSPVCALKPKMQLCSV